MADEVIIGGAGADTIDLVGVAVAAQTVVVNAGDSGITLATADKISNFNTGEDFLDFNLVDGSATNFLFDASAGGFLDALVNANAAFANDSALRYVASTDNTNTWVFVDRDGNGTADQVVELSGIVLIGAADIIA